jgi:hypothetical protein
MKVLLDNYLEQVSEELEIRDFKLQRLHEAAFGAEPVTESATSLDDDSFSLFESGDVGSEDYSDAEPIIMNEEAYQQYTEAVSDTLKSLWRAIVRFVKSLFVSSGYRISGKEAHTIVSTLKEASEDGKLESGSLKNLVQKGFYLIAGLGTSVDGVALKSAYDNGQIVEFVSRNIHKVNINKIPEDASFRVAIGTYENNIKNSVAVAGAVFSTMTKGGIKAVEKLAGSVKEGGNKALNKAKNMLKKESIMTDSDIEDLFGMCESVLEVDELAGFFESLADEEAMFEARSDSQVQAELTSLREKLKNPDLKYTEKKKLQDRLARVERESSGHDNQEAFDGIGGTAKADARADHAKRQSSAAKSFNRLDKVEATAKAAREKVAKEEQDAADHRAYMDSRSGEDLDDGRFDTIVSAAKQADTEVTALVNVEQEATSEDLDNVSKALVVINSGKELAQIAAATANQSGGKADKKTILGKLQDAIKNAASAVKGAGLKTIGAIVKWLRTNITKIMEAVVLVAFRWPIGGAILAGFIVNKVLDAWQKINPNVKVWRIRRKAVGVGMAVGAGAVIALGAYAIVRKARATKTYGQSNDHINMATFTFVNETKSTAMCKIRLYANDTVHNYDVKGQENVKALQSDLVELFEKISADSDKVQPGIQEGLRELGNTMTSLFSGLVTKTAKA